MITIILILMLLAMLTTITMIRVSCNEFKNNYAAAVWIFYLIVLSILSTLSLLYLVTLVVAKQRAMPPMCQVPDSLDWPSSGSSCCHAEKSPSCH